MSIFPGFRLEKNLGGIIGGMESMENPMPPKFDEGLNLYWDYEFV